MPVISRRDAPQANLPADEVDCPCCQGKLVRQRRRIADRLRSLIRPLKRYRCENFACQWMGNIADADAYRSDTGMAAGTQTPAKKSGPTNGVPVAFIVHMILVVAGVIFVLVYSTMEPAASFDERESAGELAALQ